MPDDVTDAPLVPDLEPFTELQAKALQELRREWKEAFIELRNDIVRLDRFVVGDDEWIPRCLLRSK
jgi:hypothetical protein